MSGGSNSGMNSQSALSGLNTQYVNFTPPPSVPSTISSANPNWQPYQWRQDATSSASSPTPNVLPPSVPQTPPGAGPSGFQLATPYDANASIAPAGPSMPRMNPIPWNRIGGMSMGGMPPWAMRQYFSPYQPRPVTGPTPNVLPPAAPQVSPTTPAQPTPSREFNPFAPYGGAPTGFTMDQIAPYLRRRFMAPTPDYGGGGSI
jgi:hypothetical protein